MALIGALVLWTGWATSAVAATWVRPVPGKVTRNFSLASSPFAQGQHRGVDLHARPGARVRSACSGVVVFVGVVARLGRVVSVRCGRWRVSYLPLATAGVRRGALVAAHARIGTVDGGHHGALHVGVRREGRRFGYVDPLTRFGADPPPPVVVRPPGLGPAPRPAPPRAVPALRRVPLRSRRVAMREPSLAPWPAWVGLALLLTGAVGGRTVVRRRSTRTAPVVAAVRTAR